MRVRLLGVAAGGGLPQWNCRCRNCEAARHGQTAPLGECSLAFSPDEANWYLVNAAADVTRQLARWPELHPRSGIRSAPIRGVIVTAGELDHVLGLFHLREGMRWTLYATPAVASMLEEDLRLLPALRRYADVVVRGLAPDEPLSLGEGPSQVEMRLVETSDRAPRYARESDQALRGAVVAAVLKDVSTGKRVLYAPGVGRLSDALREHCRGADVILFDGTFWSNDELRRLGISQDAATDMGHVPVSGPDGSALWLSALPVTAKFYVHLNNTNPLLDPASQERAWIRRLGLDVGDDRWTVTL